MTRSQNANPKFADEQAVQDWLEGVVQANALRSTIVGAEEIDAALVEADEPELWPPFPIDYLSRKRNLAAAKAVLGALTGLTLISKNARSLSRSTGEALFADLLYCSEPTASFVLFELKNRKASTREAVTELLAYEHEILNHIPFAGARDLVMVVVSRDFPPLLDHAVTGLNTWSRRNVLCLRVDDSGAAPTLSIHIPKAWAAIGQRTLPADAIATAYLTFEPSSDLDDDDIRSVCETASALIVREAERAGSSGFAMVSYDHIGDMRTGAAYLVMVGVVNPYAFLRPAEAAGFLDADDSPIAEFVLENGDLSAAWDGVASEARPALDYLRSFGRARMETLSTWSSFRDLDRLRFNGLTPDRHLTPVSLDFWGVLGDYVRDAVRHNERMANFMPGMAKPRVDWRSPYLGTLLLDDIAVEPVVDAGQWTFSTIFAFGLRLGRWSAIEVNRNEGDAEKQRLMRAAAFWAEIDLVEMLHEVSLRYMSARDITEPPPPLRFSRHLDEAQMRADVGAFTAWFRRAFISPDDKFFQQAFVVGLRNFGVFDQQFDPTGAGPEMADQRREAAEWALDWLKWSAVAATGELRDTAATQAGFREIFGDRIPLDEGKEAAFAVIEAMDERELIHRLFRDIPHLMDLWHPQLAHDLAPQAAVDRDWDWFSDQIAAARSRGVKNPCIAIGAGGQIGVAHIPEDRMAPKVPDPATHVLLVLNQSGFEVTLVVTWHSLRTGTHPGGPNASATSEGTPP